MLLESRGSLIVRRLCVLLGAERVFREMAGILMEEANIEFAGTCLEQRVAGDALLSFAFCRCDDTGIEPHTAHRLGGTTCTVAAKPCAAQD